MRKTYTAVCERSGSWWAISVRDVPGVHTQARRLDQAEAMAREAIALMLEVPEDSFDVALEAHPPDEVLPLLERAVRLRRDSEASQAAASEETRKAARKLLAMGFTVRDAGTLLGVSPQRVSQLVPSARGGGPRSGLKREQAGAGQARHN